MNSTRRPLTALATVLVGVTALGACTSTPSNKRVVEDIIESLTDLPADVRQCMLDKVERYEGDQLDDIADANEKGDGFALTPDGEIQEGSDALMAFEADLRKCVDGEATDSTAPEGTGVPSSGAESSEPASTEAAEATATTDAVGSTAPDTTLG